jgi:hypothetical protein
MLLLFPLTFSLHFDTIRPVSERQHIFGKVKKVSAILGNIIDRRSAALLSARVALNGAWTEVVGERLADVTSLDDLRFTGKDELLVTIKILNSAMVFAKYGANEIALKISQISGVRNVRLHFKKATTIEKIVVVSESPEEAWPAKVRQSIDVDFRNVALKNALEALKTEMQDAA